MTSLKDWRGYAKAIVGGVTAFVTAGAVAAVDNAITAGEWWTMAAAGLASFGVVFGVPNRETDDTERSDDDYSPKHQTEG